MFGDLFSQNSDYQKGIIYQGRRKFLVPKGKNSLEPPTEFKTRKQSSRSLLIAKSLAEKNEPTGVDIVPANLAAVILNTKNSFLSLRNSDNFKSKRNVKNGAAKPLVIHHYSSVDSKDWEEQYQAGCHLYVNKNTGEVSVTCPWQNNIHQISRSKLLQQENFVQGSPSKREGSTHSLSHYSLAPSSPSPAQFSSPMSASASPNVFVSSGSSVISLGSLGISSGRYQVYDEEEELGTGSLVYYRSELDEMFSVLDCDGGNTIKKKQSPPL